MKKWFKRLFSKKRNFGSVRMSQTEEPKPIIEEDYIPKDEYTIKGTLYKIGDRVITKSNECDPLLVGTIVEFWDNNGVWDSCIPYIEDDNGEVCGVMGHITHYDEKIMEDLEGLRPLEQWNYFLPEDSSYRYSEEDMDRKEQAYQKKKEFFGQ